MKHLLGIRKVLNLGLKAEKQLQNRNHTEDWALQHKNHTEDWALGNHPDDNDHVTH